MLRQKKKLLFVSWTETRLTKDCGEKCIRYAKDLAIFDRRDCRQRLYLEVKYYVERLKFADNFFSFFFFFV